MQCFHSTSIIYRGPARFHRLTPNKRFEPMSSTVIMAVCSLFSRLLLSTDLITVHLLYCVEHTVIIGAHCDNRCTLCTLEQIRAVRHICGMICHMQGFYSAY